MKKERIENAIKILEYAINNKVSVKAASLEFGFADTYFKNTKKDIFRIYEDKSLAINTPLFNKFVELYEDYTNLSKIPTPQQPSPLKNVENNEQVSFESKGNEANVELKFKNYPPNHVKTLDDLLKRCNVNLDLWNVDNYVINKWDVTSWKNQNPQTIENYQVKAKLIKKYDDVEVLDVATVFKNMVESYVPPVLDISPRKFNSHERSLLEISLFDLHLGKFGWSGLVNDEFNIETAKKRFIDAIIKTIDRSMPYNVERILFPIGNDFFNVDTSNNVLPTTAGNTPQQEERSWQETFNIGTKLIVDAISLMKQVGVPVDVLVVPGNHDYSKSFYLGAYLEAWFNNDKQVNINNNASPRKYYKYGNVLLGFSHGKYEKQDSLPLLMATEEKENWGTTIFHEWHLGHIHRKKNINYTVLDKSKTINEDLGVTVRYLSSLSGDDEWHHKNGFVGSVKAGDGFVWSNRYGLLAHINTNIISE